MQRSGLLRLHDAELVALDVGESCPLEVHVPNVPQTGCPKADEAVHLGLAVRCVPIEMHLVLRGLALGPSRT